ncbi:MAG: hypothetical protein WAU78_01990 [Roseiarcus sp.]
MSVLVVGIVVAIAIAAALAPVVLPIGDRMAVDGQSVAAGVIFVGSYLALAIGRIPGLSIDRAGMPWSARASWWRPGRRRSKAPTKRSTATRSLCCSA